MSEEYSEYLYFMRRWFEEGNVSMIGWRSPNGDSIKDLCKQVNGRWVETFEALSRKYPSYTFEYPAWKLITRNFLDEVLIMIENGHPTNIKMNDEGLYLLAGCANLKIYTKLVEAGAEVILDYEHWPSACKDADWLAYILLQAKKPLPRMGPYEIISRAFFDDFIRHDKRTKSHSVNEERKLMIVLLRRVVTFSRRPLTKVISSYINFIYQYDLRDQCIELLFFLSSVGLFSVSSISYEESKFIARTSVHNQSFTEALLEQPNILFTE
jgi:hypothetical protein